jgi:uncharacterized protein
MSLFVVAVATAGNHTPARTGQQQFHSTYRLRVAIIQSVYQLNKAITMLSILAQWNRWGSAVLKSGYPREVTTKLLPFIDSPEIVTLTGLRRAGKTTILYQIMDYLTDRGIPEDAMLHVNFEEPGLAPRLKLELLDELYQSYRNAVYPKGKAWLFFDEIQNVPGWERWVRARNESEDIKIFITGSSANLMSRELATLLTGRHVNFHVSPLSFSEFLTFKKIQPPKKKFPINPPAEIQHALDQYLQWGGLPEVALSTNEERKKILLKQYFDDLLFKDVAMRHQIRDVRTLRNIAVHLLTQTASLISVNRIANLFQISLEMARNYCAFLQESFLVDFLPFYSLKVAERNRNPQKVYACDSGLRHIVSIAETPDRGRIAETAVYQHLQRINGGDVFYWKGKQEVDFVIRQGNTISSLVQVAYDNLDDHKTLTRELNALTEAQSKFPQAKAKLIAAKIPKTKIDTLTPLWAFLLGSC